MAQGPANWPAGDPLELGPGVGSVLPVASLAGTGLQKALAARPHGPQPPEPPWLSPDHNVTVPSLCSHRLAAVALAWPPCPPAPWVLATPPPAALRCLGANPAASLLPCSRLPACTGPCPAAPSLQASGRASLLSCQETPVAPSGPRGGGQVSHAPRCSRTPPHRVCTRHWGPGPGHRGEGSPELGCQSAWSRAPPAEAKLAGEMAANA